MDKNESSIGTQEHFSKIIFLKQKPDTDNIYHKMIINLIFLLQAKTFLTI